MKSLITGAALGLVFGLFSSVEGLECLSCTNAADIQECVVNSATCTNSSTVVEECYMDVTVLPSLQRVYSAGCRDESVCKILSSLAGKRSISKRQSIACAECCKTDPGQDGLPCNGKLCNLDIKLPNATCGICDRIKNPSECAVSQQCPDNEQCRIDQIFSNGGVIYRLGCGKKTECDMNLQAYKCTHSGSGANVSTPAPGGRRDSGDIPLCTACCATRDCNKNPCKELRNKQQCNDGTVCGSGVTCPKQ